MNPLLKVSLFFVFKISPIGNILLLLFYLIKSYPSSNIQFRSHLFYKPFPNSIIQKYYRIDLYHKTKISIVENTHSSHLTQEANEITEFSHQIPSKVIYKVRLYYTHKNCISIKLSGSLSRKKGNLTSINISV